MAGDVKNRYRQGADAEGISVLEQHIELRTVMREFGAGVEQLAKHGLQRSDVLADRDCAAKPFLKIGRGREVIGMGMGLEQPNHLQIMRSDVFDDRIGRGRRGAARIGIKVEHRVDNRRLAGRRIAHHVGDGESGRIKEAGDFRPQRRTSPRTLDLRGRRSKDRIIGTHDNSPIIYINRVYILQCQCQVI